MRSVAKCVSVRHPFFSGKNPPKYLLTRLYSLTRATWLPPRGARRLAAHTPGGTCPLARRLPPHPPPPRGNPFLSRTANLPTIIDSTNRVHPTVCTYKYVVFQTVQGYYQYPGCVFIKTQIEYHPKFMRACLRPTEA